MPTAYHAKYFAYDLTRQAPSSDPGRLSMSLFDATVDLNPHQIEAALFALNSPLSKGAILADEVGLGKTIEAGIVLCQFWAERKRKLLIVCPASLRKQWQMELEEKFNLPSVVLDAKAYREFQKAGVYQPFNQKQILITSYHYAGRMKDEIRAMGWDLAIIDEAHKLRNCYRDSNKLGQAIRWALNDCRKLLLTATPLQNSLMELYGLSTLIDEHFFGDVGSFRSQYTGAGSNIADLRQRLSSVCKRTLRRDVLEYVRYTKRKPITRPFSPTDNEQKLYEAVSEFLQREDTYAIPKRQRHLTLLLVRKLLASSSYAIAGTMETMKLRLEAIRDQRPVEETFLEDWLESEEVEDDLLDELLADIDQQEQPAAEEEAVDYKKLQDEIDELDRYAHWARSIGVDTKSTVLLKALSIGFEEIARMGASRKALIFTESRRTQDYLKQYLEKNGYAGQVVAFNGTNNGPEAKAIYEAWAAANQENGRATGSRAVDARTALVEHFRDNATIMLATEAAAEGINLQFCSQIVNYDLPWNPQRIEQRIGRCHRYGQKHDVVVINFLNERNQADIRVHELLDEKFSLFDGLFGASDDVLGTIESGVDFEKRILAIYQECRTHDQIEAAFNALQQELDESIKQRMADTQKLLFDHFDEDVHQRLKMQLESAQRQLDHFGKRFWQLTEYVLQDRAVFNQSQLLFDLNAPPATDIHPGRYHLISKTQPREEGEPTNPHGYFLYRLSHPLGEWSVDTAKALPVPAAELVFDITNHGARIAMVEALKGKSGYLCLEKLTVESYEKEEYLLFSAFTDDGASLDQETCEKLFACEASSHTSALPLDSLTRLQQEATRHAQATISRSLEANNSYFNEARDRLDKWAEDMVLAAEKALRDTKEQIKALKREARQAATLQEQKEHQEKLGALERKQRKQRQEIFAVEDEIMARRDALVGQLETRLSQKTGREPLFVVRWHVA